MLQLCFPKIELVTNPIIYETFSKNIRGGIILSGKRMAEISSTVIDQQIKYFDIKSLYSFIETLAHPIDRIEILEPTPLFPN